MCRLQEQPHQIQLFKRVAARLGPEGSWKVLQAAEQAIKANSAVCFNPSHGRRSAGAVFLALARDR